MQVTDLLGQLGGAQSMARELGVSESQVQSGATALLPAILGGFKNQTRAQPNGLDGLGSMLDGLGGGALMDDVLSPQPTNVQRGNDVLGRIFGSRDVSRAVAQHASTRSGVDPALLKRMLPMLAMLVAGYMSRQASTGTRGSAPHGVGPASTSGSGGLGGLIGSVLGGGAGGAGDAAATSRAGGRSGGLASMLDLDGDGNPLDDILGMTRGLGR